MKRLCDLLFVLMPAVAMAHTITFQAAVATGPGYSNDTYVLKGDSTDNRTTTTLIVGMSSSLPVRTCLVGHFEIVVPKSATVTSCTLLVRSGGAATGTPNDSLMIASLRDSARYSGTIFPSWYHKAKPGTLWNTAGLKGGFDYDTTALDTAYKSTDTTATGTWRFTGETFRRWAQAVVKGDSINYGWILKTRWPEKGASNYWVFGAQDNVTAANRWVFILVYSVGELPTRNQGTILQQARGTSVLFTRNRGKIIAMATRREL